MKKYADRCEYTTYFSRIATAAIFPIIDRAFSGNFCARKRLVALL